MLADANGRLERALGDGEVLSVKQFVSDRWTVWSGLHPSYADSAFEKTDLRESLKVGDVITGLGLQIEVLVVGRTFAIAKGAG